MQQTLAIGDWDDRLSGYYVGETDTHLIHALPMIFNTRLVITRKDSDLKGWEDAWCYRDIASCMIAAATWDPAIEPEPTGWHKHPLSRRVRPDGDPTKEYVSD